MKRSRKRNLRGFTLVELLVVGGVFLTILTVILSIFITILRGSKKSDSVILVQQNGDQALTQIVRALRFAQSLNSPSIVGGAAPSCSSGGVSVQSVQVTMVDLTTNTLTCPGNFNYPNFISLNGINLTNSNTVVVKSCSFVCKQLPGGPPSIGISFSLTKINSKGLPEGETTIPFQSTVTLRNIGG